MKNNEVSTLLYTIADLLDIKGDNYFKIRAYRLAAQIINDLSENIETVFEENRLEDINGIGSAIAQKIKEYLSTGSLSYFDELKKEVPISLLELLDIPSLGPKKVSILFHQLNIQTIDALKQACLEGKLRDLEGFGILTEHNILRGISLKEKIKGRILLYHATEISEKLIKYLKNCKAIQQVDIAGSVRRKKETVGDIDILVSSTNQKEVNHWIVHYPQIKEIIAKGETKTSIFLNNHVQVDIRVVEPKNYGSALQYFTGSKEHNVSMRALALKLGYKLNEYGLFKKKDDTYVCGKDEKEIYQKLKLDYIPPELRENRGEINASLKHTLPTLLTLDDIKGDLHVHSNYSDGHNSIEEMIQRAELLGYDYIGITDHSQSLHVAHGLDYATILKKAEEIKTLNSTSNITIFLGTECDILPNGNLDYDDDTLSLFDYVGIGIHTKFKMTKQEATERITQAMKHPSVTFLAHPTCRLFGQRESLPIDMETLFETAVDTNTYLEINSFPDRLDLQDIYVKLGKEMNAQFCIGTDAHSVDHLSYMSNGVSNARRGWLEKKDVLNTCSKEKIKTFFNQ